MKTIKKFTESKRSYIKRFSKSPLYKFLEDFDFNLLGSRGNVSIRDYNDNFIKVEVYLDADLGYSWLDCDYDKEDDILMTDDFGSEKVFVEIIKIILKGRR